MPVNFRIFHNPDVVLIRYYGHVRVAELIDALSAFAATPDAPKDAMHFIDASQTTSYEKDWTQFSVFMAELASVYPETGAEKQFVIYAPPGPPAELAEKARRPWDASPTVNVRVAASRADAFDILGFTHPELGLHLDEMGVM